MNAILSFQAGQIVGLDYNNTCLYAEVIQIVIQRQICWVRPLFLLEFPFDSNPVNPNFLASNEHSPKIHDLRESSDLIWPIQLFRPALDTEVIPFLMELESPDSKSTVSSTAHQQFRSFIRQVWQAYPQPFQDLKNNI